MQLRHFLFAALLLGVSVSGKRRKHGRDGEFENFESAVEIGGGQHDGGYQPSLQEQHGGYVEEDSSYDPRLPDPPCVWTTWSGCDSACGGGSSYRLRRIDEECAYGPAEQLKSCNTQPCPTDCVVGEWGEWGCGEGCSGCSVPCGGGSRTRTRPVLAPALFGGRCDYELSESEPCNQHACPVDCVATSLWSEWSVCSAVCGLGRRVRTRSVDFVPVVRAGESHSEAECPQSAEEEVCGQPCPVNCVVGEWSPWGLCTASCGPDGAQLRHRDVFVFPQNGGEDCPSILELRSCDPAPFDCPSLDIPEPVYHESGYRTFRGDPIILPPIADPILLPTTTEAPTIDPNFCNDKPDGPYEFPDCICCNDLVMCFQRTAIIKWCPPGEVFVGGQYSKCMKRAVAPNC